MVWPPGAPLVARLRAADLAIVSGYGPAFAQFTGKPYCFFVTGGDLTKAPFPLRFHFTYPTLRAKLVMGLLALWQRRGVRRSTQIWTQPFAPFRDAQHGRASPPSGSLRTTIR